MRVLMGIIRRPNGVFYARKKVPSHLTKAVAQVLNDDKPSLSWLKRSLGTRDGREANVVAKPILMEFDRTLAKAEALLKARPVRDSLSQDEIRRIAEYYHVSLLADDDDIRQFGTGSEVLSQNIAKQLAEAGVPVVTAFALKPPPAYGLSDREMVKREEAIDAGLAIAKAALARGNIVEVENEEELDNLLALFGVNLDRKSRVYRELGLTVLRKKVAAFQTLEQRHRGEPIETPRVAEPTAPAEVVPGSSLGGAFEGYSPRRDPRYTQSYLDTENVEYVRIRQYQSRYPAIVHENIAITSYFFQHGRLPRLNKVFR